MRIAIGADHAGFELKEKLRQHLTHQGNEVSDQGTASNESVDYPDFAGKVAHEVSAGRADFGVLVCGSGIGMAIAANKVPGIRAANITSEYEAQLSREHNDANVVAIGSRILKEDAAKAIIDRFLLTAFAHGRHAQRIQKIAEMERREAGAAKA